MLKTEKIVINTSPLISLMAAMGDLEHALQQSACAFRSV